MRDNIENEDLSRLPEKTYEIQYQPQLVEEAVLRAVSGTANDRPFRRERDKIYDLREEDDRDAAFRHFHLKWFRRLELDAPVHEAYTDWPTLSSETQRTLIVKARAPKEMGAELYVAAAVNSADEREDRSILLQVTPELLVQSSQVATLLRRELLHIVDMLDPEFGYDPIFPASEVGPSYEHFLQQRYRVLWNLSVDGRLCQKGWLPSTVRDEHWAIFQNTFSGPVTDMQRIFSDFFTHRPTHQTLLSFILTPDTWFHGENSEQNSRGKCSICHFPSFQLLDSGKDLPTAVAVAIQRENPTWHPTRPICRQCCDLFESRFTAKKMN